MNNFSIVDDETKLVFGYCTDILGFAGECSIEIDDDLYHKITLIDFRITEIFRKYCADTKKCISNIYLTLLDRSGNSLAAYYFYSKDGFYLQKNGFGDGGLDLELIGTLSPIVSKEALEIWEMWRESPPKTKNLWVKMSKKQRVGWLEVVRMHSIFTNRIDHKNGKYYLNATDVTDETSFYCAVGEAINGSGGYYGFNLDVFEDCLRGGFGAVPPFTIYLNNVKFHSNEVQHTENQFILRKDKIFFQKLNEILVAMDVTLIKE